MSLTVISREQWGAQHAPGFGARALPTAEAWLHHSATLSPDLAFSDLNADSLDDDEVQAMRQVERIGQQRFGGGFSYNLAVAPSGRLYEGCGIGRVGAHTAQRNTRALGVVLIGDYDREQVPAPMQDTLVALLVEGHRLGWIDQPRFDGGHRDLKRTACPGQHAYALLGSLNARAAQGLPTTPAAPHRPAQRPTAPVQRPTAPAKAPLPRFPLPPGWYFGPKDGPRVSVSGYYGHRDDLAAFQRRLRERGWKIGADGLYGPETAAVVRAFQREKGLAVDGLIGPSTWRAAWVAPVT